MTRPVATETDLSDHVRCFECKHPFRNGDEILFVPASRADKPRIGQDMAPLRGLVYCKTHAPIGMLTGVVWGHGCFGGHHRIGR
jgi:hypothetical protein